MGAAGIAVSSAPHCSLQPSRFPPSFKLNSNVTVVTRPLVFHVCKLPHFDNLALRPGASLKECECELEYRPLAANCWCSPEGLLHGDQGFPPLPSGLWSPTMTSSEGVLERGEQPCIRLEPLKKMHLPGKATPTGGSCAALIDSSPKVTANGVHDIEDRILRITGYYGYNPGYSSHRSEYNAED